MSAEVVISLPGASQFDAEAFGLWLESVLRAAREDGRLDMDTEYGISVPPAGSRSSKPAKRKTAQSVDNERPDPNVLIEFVWRNDGTYNYRWWPEGPITPENADVIVAGVLTNVAQQIHAKIAGAPTNGHGGAAHG